MPKKLLYLHINAEGTSVSRFIEEMENVINRSMLGTSTSTDPCPMSVDVSVRHGEKGDRSDYHGQRKDPKDY